MRFTTLQEWLRWQETLHPTEIDLGLDRVQAVLQRMRLGPPGFSVISVAGTNGKGSSVAMLDAIYRAAGYKTGAYISPHIKRYNERISINGEAVSDDALCGVFEHIDRSRGNISLTYFEFGTLAAIALLQQAKVDIAIMEVGLGGQLDAVNVLDADAALITSIGLDHQAWLGNTRESIALEKAGIARPQRPVVCGDPAPPQNLLDFLRALDAPLYVLNRDFFYHKENAGTWRWRSKEQQRYGLPLPALRGDIQLYNAAAVLMVVQLLAESFPVSNANIRVGLLTAIQPGRFQVIPGTVPMIVDVAHNPQAAQALAATLKQMPCRGKTHAVFGVMKDKDVSGILNALRDGVGYWYLADLKVERALAAKDIQSIMQNNRISAPVSCHASVRLAKESAMAAASKEDRVLVFGSFYVVSEIL
ncbi:MAG: bifunctional tetrahydrofolate synthase/dihydrofolate synthase [Gammaproteobacteria bacterium]|nr:bifunctional tetrahydrofolate synthase/dihydrofolate synthase [Gammaproteobacteria bacterium]